MHLLVGHVDVITVEIETVIGTGFSGLNILGLNTEATRDMRERIRSALESIGIPIPSKRIVVNITPSEFIKISRIPLSQLDFAVAGCIIYALIDDNEKQNKLFKPNNEFLAGELSLSGKSKEIQNPLIYQSAIIQNNNNIKLCLLRKNLSYNSIFLENKTEFFDSIEEWYQKRKK
jgi:magnesium chelatase family protein